MKFLAVFFDYTKSKMFVEKVNDKGDKSVVLSSPYNFVSRNEIVVKIVDAADQEEAKNALSKSYQYFNLIPFVKFKAAGSVFFDGTDKSYKASWYGFAVLDRAMNLKIIPPLQIEKTKTKAFYIVFPTKFGKLPSYPDIEEMYKINKIITPIDKVDVDKEIAKLTRDKKVTKILIAKSKEPINGRDEYYLPLIDIKKKAGEVLEDGRMNFKEIGSIHEVKKSQQILQRFKEIKPVDGFDIYGDKKSAETEKVEGFQRGENIVQSGSNEDIFVSAIDGCLVVDRKSISIKQIVVINKNVDYESGNVNYHGSVHVKGSVLPGFSVVADGDVIIEGNVDDAIIESQGSVTVKGGICGKGSSFVKAVQNVTAKYILNTKVEAGGIVIAEDSIINSDVFANDKVFVVSQHAKIMGGKITARHRIEANFAGSAKEANTILSVGRNLEVERELTEIRKSINEKKLQIEDVMASIRTSFGTNLFEDPKKFISILPDIKKKQCIRLLSELNKLQAELKELGVAGMKVEEKLVLDETPLIIIKEKVYAGTVINIKKQVRKIEGEDITNAKFYEDLELKIIKYTAAV